MWPFLRRRRTAARDPVLAKYPIGTRFRHKFLDLTVVVARTFDGAAYADIPSYPATYILHYLDRSGRLHTIDTTECFLDRTFRYEAPAEGRDSK